MKGSRVDESEREKWKQARWVALFFLVAILALLVRPVIHVARALRADRDERQPAPVGFIDDASRLNRTEVREVWTLPADAEDPEARLRELLHRARSEGLRVSIAGARHSMGGHTLYPGGIVVDMLPWKRMELSGDVLTVGAGALWSEVLPFLDPHGLSVAIMQSNSSFSVGGSVSVNCHGWQFPAAPIAASVLGLRVMLADGTVVCCSRTERSELFTLVLGGYGLFGIILEVDLALVPNERYRAEQVVVPIEQLVETIEDRRGQDDVRMLFARLNVVPANLLGEALVASFHCEEGAVPAWVAHGWEDLRRAVFRGSEGSDYGKRVRWFAETELQDWIVPEAFSRNALLREEVAVFENRRASTTDVLHEYFVPLARVASFLSQVRTAVGASDVDLMNVTARYVAPDTETFLRYADTEMLAFVLLFAQPCTAAGEEQMRDLTRGLIDIALEHGGRYYLPYRLHATRVQFEAAYPQAADFFAAKRRYDPGELFQSTFYEHYAR